MKHARTVVASLVALSAVHTLPAHAQPKDGGKMVVITAPLEKLLQFKTANGGMAYVYEEGVVTAEHLKLFGEFGWLRINAETGEVLAFQGLTDEEYEKNPSAPDIITRYCRIQPLRLRVPQLAPPAHMDATMREPYFTAKDLKNAASFNTEEMMMIEDVLVKAIKGMPVRSFEDNKGRTRLLHIATRISTDCAMKIG